MEFEIKANIGFTDDFYNSSISVEDWETVENDIMDLPFVHIAWINHSCIVELHLETEDFDLAKERVYDTMVKVSKILDKYASD